MGRDGLTGSGRNDGCIYFYGYPTKTGQYLFLLDFTDCSGLDG